LHKTTVESRVLTYARLQLEYEEEARRGTSMSVHERYCRELDTLRHGLQKVHMKRPLGQILVEMGLVSQAHVTRAREIQQLRADTPLLGEILVQQGVLSPAALYRALRTQIQESESR